MAKLVTRQEVPLPWYKQHLHYWTYVAAAGLGLFVLFGFLWSLAKSPESVAVTSNPLSTPVITSAQNSTAQAEYLAQNQAFNQLKQQYERLAAQGRDDYQLHNALDFQAQAIVTVLNKLEGLLPTLGLNATELQQNQSRQVYLKDYWQAKQHFHQLRVASLRATQQPITTIPEQVTPVLKAPMNNELPLQAQAQGTDDLQKAGNKSRFATPPAGVELPPDFCQLGAEGVCKAQ